MDSYREAGTDLPGTPQANTAVSFSEADTRQHTETLAFTNTTCKGKMRSYLGWNFLLFVEFTTNLLRRPSVRTLSVVTENSWGFKGRMALAYSHEIAEETGVGPKKRHSAERKETRQERKRLLIFCASNTPHKELAWATFVGKNTRHRYSMTPQPA